MRPSLPSSDMAISATVAASIAGAPSRPLSGWIGSGLIRAVRPRMNRMLKMFVPAMLPTTSPSRPSAPAVRPIASSGRLLPTVTTVSPSTIGLTPSMTASRELPRSMSSAPIASSTSPAMKTMAG